MLTIILWVLGVVLTWRLCGLDSTTPEGVMKFALGIPERIAASVFWPACAAYVLYDAVMEWIEERRNRP